MTINIGTFARLAGVSVRMLRHYDHIHLLPPARTDPNTGHRTYALEQLVVLNRIVALKGLGFTLQEVSRLLNQGIESAELHGMLRLRQSQLERQMLQHQHRIRRVAARLALIEQEHRMSDATLKHLPPQRLVGLSGTAPDPGRSSVGRLVEQLFIRVADHLEQEGGDRTAPVARYVPVPGQETAVRVTAGYVLTQGAVLELEVIDLPEVDVAAVIHQGPMVDVNAAYQELARWAQTNDRAGALRRGSWREVYLEAGGEDQQDWIVEVQLELD